MNKSFKIGFMKFAAQLLSEQSYNMDNSEHQKERQEILESSYDKETGRPEKIVKRNKLYKEESTRSSTDPYLIGRH